MASESLMTVEQVAHYLNIPVKTVYRWRLTGTGRPGHPSADLTADHAGLVGLGAPADGPLVVRCRSCNAARAAAIMARAFGSPMGDRPTTPRPSKFPTHTGDGPAVA